MSRPGRGYPSKPGPANLPTVPTGFAEGGPVLPGRPIRYERGCDPHARVTKAGRWIYHIVIIDGLLEYRTDAGPWFAWGRAHAMRKAERKLLKHLRDKDRADHPIIIRPESLEDLQRRLLEAQAKPQPWELISEPRDTGDRWGIWPLLILMAIFAAGFALGTWVQ